MPVLLAFLCVLPLRGEEKEITVIVDGTAVAANPPAQFVGDALYLSAREFLDALGAEAEWDDGAKTLTARLPRIIGRFTLGKSQARRNEQTIDEGLPFRLLGGKGFLPARLAAKVLDCSVEWKAEARRVEVRSLWTKQAVIVGEIIRWPRYLRGKQITLQGEYRGWSPSETGPAVEKGRPKRRADWVLRDSTGAIYVSGRSPKGLDPLDDIGSLVAVEGAGGLTREGKIPFVEAAAVAVTMRKQAPR